MNDNVSRRNFVTIIGTAAAAETFGATSDVDAATKHAAPRAEPLSTTPEAYAYFSQPEAAFVEAAVERLIPANALGPGAREAGVAYFIDQQLDGQFGYGAKMYMQGAWQPGLATQGYQLPLTPRDIYRLGISETNAYSQRRFGKTFDQLSSAAHQDTILEALDRGSVTFQSVPAKTFFDVLLTNTLEGFFGDPMYGGNRDMIGWKLVGFPGAAAAYIGLIEVHNKAYNVSPVSIANLQQAEQTAMAEMPTSTDMGDMDMDVHVALAKKALGVR
jgi:gluconate 2-dehydrogenase gamma chain